MRRADHVVHVEQRVAGVAQRLFFVDIHCRLARASGFESGDQCAGFDERRAAGVDDQGSGLHASEIAGSHNAARRLDQAQVQGDDVGFLEKRFLAARCGAAVGAPRASEASRAHTSTFMPKALPYPATTAPILP